MELKYISALWKNSFLKQFISFFYSLPVMLVIFTNLLQIVLPCYSIYMFYDRGDFTYFYDMPMYISEDEKSIDFVNEEEGISLLYSNSTIIYSNHRKKDNEQFSFYENSISDNVFFTTQDKDVSKTFFTKQNFISSNKKEENSIYIAYGTAKTLDVKEGEVVTIKIKYIDNEKTKEEIIHLKIAGYLKPLYKELTLSYGKHEGFTSLAYISNDLYEKMKYEAISISNYFFTDIEQVSKISDYRMSKQEIKDSIMNYISKAEVKQQVVVTAVSVILVIIILTYFELSFVRRKNRKDIETFSKLGMQTKSIRKIYILNILISYVITVILALVISKFIYLDRMLAVYCDPELISLFFSALLTIGIISIIVQSLLIRKLN